MTGRRFRFRRLILLPAAIEATLSRFSLRDMLPCSAIFCLRAARYQRAMLRCAITPAPLMTLPLHTELPAAIAADTLADALAAAAAIAAEH